MTEQLSLFTQRRARQVDFLPPRIQPRSTSRPGVDLEAVCHGLTEAQAQAVVHGQGPLLIVAGAGTGKTTVIARRIAALIGQGRAQPAQLLALTFTDKAAGEMRERVDSLLPYGLSDVAIATFHAFGDRLLRRFSLELGLSSDFKVLTAAEQVIFLRNRLFDLPLQRYRPLGNPTTYLQALVAHFSRLKDEDISPRTYLGWAHQLQAQAGASLEARDRAEAHLELATAYDRVASLMFEAGYLDFADLVTLSLELLRSRPAVLASLREEYRYLLVDEFQDTNLAQFELVRLLSAPSHNLTVVGDDDQSIYRFRGAAISNILQFKARYPQARQVVLRDNFRSGQTILDAAYRLIRHNDPDRLEVRNGIDKQLIAQPDASGRIRARVFDTVSQEADAVAEQIAEWAAQGTYSYRDCAILVRANRDADPYLRALNMKSIPYRFGGSRGLYSRPEIRLALSWCRSLCDPLDSLSLFYLASSEVYALPASVLMLLSSYARRRHLPLRRTMEQQLSEPTEEADLGLSASDRLAIERLLRELDGYTQAIPSESPGRLLYRFLTESQWLARLTAGELPEAEVKVLNLARFLEHVRSFEDEHPTALLPEFLEHLDMLIEAGDSPAVVEADGPEQAVEIMTVHKSKGLEFPAVFLVGLCEGSFPTQPRAERLQFPVELIPEGEPDGAGGHVSEERRLFYVAMTRARQRLWLSCAWDGGQSRTRKPSRFLAEALPDTPELRARGGRGQALARVERFAPSDPGPRLSPMSEQRALTLSFAALEDYRNCPLRYRFAHVMRVPLEPSQAAMYGTALHSAVSALLQSRQRGQMLTFDELVQILGRVWKSQGFLSSQHEQLRYRAAIETLERFYATEREAPVPTWVEREFSISLGNTRLVGRWDRVDVRPEGVEITDYKTAPVADPGQAEERARGSLQLALYALAFRECQGRVPTAARLVFLETGVEGRVRVETAWLDRAQRDLEQVARAIRSREFPAQPRPGACQQCPYREICPSTAGT